MQHHCPHRLGTPMLQHLQLLLVTIGLITVFLRVSNPRESMQELSDAPHPFSLITAWGTGARAMESQWPGQARQKQLETNTGRWTYTILYRQGVLVHALMSVQDWVSQRTQPESAMVGAKLTLSLASCRPLLCKSTKHVHLWAAQTQLCRCSLALASRHMFKAKFMMIPDRNSSNPAGPSDYSDSLPAPPSYRMPPEHLQPSPGFGQQQFVTRLD